ncbi:MAG: hypothetical protein ACERKZ_18800 [Lachnotalea sp.]
MNLISNESTPKWKLLNRVTFSLSVLMLLIIPIQVIVYIIYPPPVTVLGFFQLYKDYPLLGLISMDLLLLFNNIFMIFIYLTLFVRLYDEWSSGAVMALTIGIVGIAIYFPSNPAFEMLTLSTKYFNAVGEQNMTYIAAGEALLAGYTGTAYNIYYVLNAVALLTFSFGIYKSHHFSKALGVWGLFAGILMLFPPTIGIVGMICSLFSLIPWIIFLILYLKQLATLCRVDGYKK